MQLIRNRFQVAVNDPFGSEELARIKLSESVHRARETLNQVVDAKRDWQANSSLEERAVLGLWLSTALLILAFNVPGMFVIAHVAPILPLVLGVEMWIGTAFRNPWSYAFGSTMFIAWMIASFFPIS